MSSNSNAKVVPSSKRPLKQMTCVCAQFVCSQEKSFAVSFKHSVFKTANCHSTYFKCER